MNPSHVLSLSLGTSNMSTAVRHHHAICSSRVVSVYVVGTVMYGTMRSAASPGPLLTGCASKCLANVHCEWEVLSLIPAATVA